MMLSRPPWIQPRGNDEADDRGGARARRDLRRSLTPAVQARRDRYAELQHRLLRNGQLEPVGDVPRSSGGSVGTRILRRALRRSAGEHNGEIRRLGENPRPAAGDYDSRSPVLGLADLSRAFRDRRDLPVVRRLRHHRQFVLSRGARRL